MGFFPKIKAKEEKLEETLYKTKAEFANFQRRTREEKLGLKDAGAAEILEQILPSLNLLEMSLKGSENASPELQNYLKGFEMISNQINMALESSGVEKINQTGIAFDHNIHEAIDSTYNPELKEEEVVSVRAQGFKYKNKVVAHAKVIINKKPQEEK